MLHNVGTDSSAAGDYYLNDLWFARNDSRRIHEVEIQRRRWWRCRLLVSLRTLEPCELRHALVVLPTSMFFIQRFLLG